MSEMVYIEAPDGQVFSGQINEVAAESEDGKPGVLIATPRWERADGSVISIDPDGKVKGGKKITEEQAVERLDAAAKKIEKQIDEGTQAGLDALSKSAGKVYDESVKLGFSEEVALIQARCVLPIFEPKK